MDLGVFLGLDGQGLGGLAGVGFTGIRWAWGCLGEFATHQRKPREQKQPTLPACRGSQTLNHVGFHKGWEPKTRSLGSPRVLPESAIYIYIHIHLWLPVYFFWCPLNP